MLRRHSTLLAFLAGILAMVGGMGWVTRELLDLERRDRESDARDALQQAVRLALWRMDTACGTMLAREAARPYFEYRAFYAADRAYTRMWEEVKPGEVLVPSALLALDDPWILLHFERCPGGIFISPQAPTGAMRDLAEASYLTPERVARAQERLRRLTAIVEAASAKEQASRSAGGGSPPRADAAGRGRRAIEAPDDTPSLVASISSGTRDYEARQQVARVASAPVPTEPPSAGAAPRSSASVADARERSRADTAASPIPEKPPSSGESLETRVETDHARDALRRLNLALGVEGPLWCGNPSGDPTAVSVDVGPLSPRWLDPRSDTPELIFVRPVSASGTWTEQGFWVDWPTLRRSLLDRVSDLLPNASIEIVPDDAEVDPSRRLAAVPALLVPGEVSPDPAPAWTPTRTTLAIAWGGLLVGIAAVGVLLHGSTQLAERRGRFVSAVTHELRTPLTTFRMYADMLADGMVPPGEAQQEYFGALKRESTRLATIVESVLDFARLGRQDRTRRRARPTPSTVGMLLDTLAPVLRARCEASGVDLRIDPGQTASLAIAADPASVERIVLNLVDNACKYARTDPKPRVDVRLATDDHTLAVRVSDNGPGIPRGEESRIFRPFERGSRQQDGNTPGLGLGLALSRALAREMHGDLTLASSVPAEFLLRIPLASRGA